MLTFSQSRTKRVCGLNILNNYSGSEERAKLLNDEEPRSSDDNDGPPDDDDMDSQAHGHDPIAHSDRIRSRYLAQILPNTGIPDRSM